MTPALFGNKYKSPNLLKNFNRGVPRNLYRGGVNFVLFPEEAEHPLGLDNPLKTIDPGVG